MTTRPAKRCRSNKSSLIDVPDQLRKPTTAELSWHKFACGLLESENLWRRLLMTIASGSSQQDMDMSANQEGSGSSEGEVWEVQAAIRQRLIEVGALPDPDRQEAPPEEPPEHENLGRIVGRPDLRQLQEMSFIHDDFRRSGTHLPDQLLPEPDSDYRRYWAMAMYGSRVDFNWHEFHSARVRLNGNDENLAAILDWEEFQLRTPVTENIWSECPTEESHPTDLDDHVYVEEMFAMNHWTQLMKNVIEAYNKANVHLSPSTDSRIPFDQSWQFREVNGKMSLELAFGWKGVMDVLHNTDDVYGICTICHPKGFILQTEGQWLRHHCSQLHEDRWAKAMDKAKARNNWRIVIFTMMEVVQTSDRFAIRGMIQHLRKLRNAKYKLRHPGSSCSSSPESTDEEASSSLNGAAQPRQYIPRISPGLYARAFLLSNTASVVSGQDCRQLQKPILEVDNWNDQFNLMILFMLIFLLTVFLSGIVIGAIVFRLPRSKAKEIPDTIWISPAKGERFHVQINCRGLRSAHNVKRFTPCKCCCSTSSDMCTMTSSTMSCTTTST